MSNQVINHVSGGEAFLSLLSKKGPFRESHHWQPGLEFIVSETDNGILLTPTTLFKRTNVENLIGCIPYLGKKKSLKAMQAGIAKGGVPLLTGFSIFFAFG